MNNLTQESIKIMDDSKGKTNFQVISNLVKNGVFSKWSPYGLDQGPVNIRNFVPQEPVVVKTK